VASSGPERFHFFEAIMTRHIRAFMLEAGDIQHRPDSLFTSQVFAVERAQHAAASHS
jgi:hypothetical protein